MSAGKTWQLVPASTSEPDALTGGGAGAVGFGAAVGFGVGLAVVGFAGAGVDVFVTAAFALVVVEGVPAADDVGALDKGKPDAGRLEAPAEAGLDALEAAGVLAPLTRLLSGGAARWWPVLHAAVMSARAVIAVAVAVAPKGRCVRFIPHLRPRTCRSEAVAALDVPDTSAGVTHVMADGRRVALCPARPTPAVSGYDIHDPDDDGGDPP